MDRTEIEKQGEEQVSCYEPEEFYMRSLDIDIAFYGNKLKKQKET